jgi:hypothetical protein
MFGRASEAEAVLPDAWLRSSAAQTVRIGNRLELAWHGGCNDDRR